MINSITEQIHTKGTVMKTMLIFLLIITAYQVKAEVELVPLDMELGYWETTSEMDIESMLANIPKEQREMLRGMMSSKMKMPVIKQCVTADSLKDLDNHLKNSFKSLGKDCDMRVLKSTAQDFNGELTCAGGATTVTVSSRSINSKRFESQMTSNMGGMGLNNIKTISEWKSAVCPDGI